MADSTTTPLLSSLSASSKPLPSLDSTIERCIGGFSWTQFLQAILVSIAWLFDAQQTFISVVTDADPTWHCNINSSTSICNSASSNICQLPQNSWSWDLPPQVSIISEWSLQCSSSFLTGLPASSFFMGCLVGGLLLATLADSSLGRKNMLFYSCLIMSLSSLLTVLFSTNVWIYSIFRFICGFGRATIGTCALVLSTELVGKRWRGQVAVTGFLFFTLGFLSLPAMAYINRGSSWRNLYIWSSIPSLIYCILVKLFVGESPRWLFVRGRREEAVSILKSIATIDNNGKSITMSFFGNVQLEEESWNVDIYSAIKILFQNKWSFRRLCLVMVIGFGVGMVYYGMPLGLGNMSFNLYMSVTFNALSELPSSLITLFLIDKMNRRSSLLGFTSLSGICSLLSVIVGKNMNWTSFQLGLELVSFFSACTAFNITMVYTLELFPTCVRNSAVSIARQALVLGGVFSPVLAAAGRKNGFWSYGIFGLVIGFCGLFVVFLPETKGGRLCDTMDEEEHKAVVNDHHI
ncbi:Organic cation/carnitine transporter 3 [Tripterygium wilfordii]|uniref:Organic cation/carnitine transporter 3 n=1 Tax=Tripterygium wilfordii TaxID=458696 RepID=A0A7J7CHP0_TRIWF|nr:organic cation/carnitine transporter 3-like [Tripterygium wilfordii]KAF5733551.1 Organic cation/carnitine transporter 3 [Tripterygium wilfordii]